MQNAELFVVIKTAGNTQFMLVLLQHWVQLCQTELFVVKQLEDCMIVVNIFCLFVALPCNLDGTNSF